MHLFITRLARWMALIGGAVLVLLIALTFISVLGRMANTFGHYELVETQMAWLSTFLTKLGPLDGDFELVEAGVAFAILSFFPWCSINRGHATVDVFTSFLPQSANRFLSLLWEGVFVFIMFVITWRMFVGMSDKMRYGETTFLLEFPVWWGYAICTFASAVASIVIFYTLYLRALQLFTGRDLFPSGGSVGH